MNILNNIEGIIAAIAGLITMGIAYNKIMSKIDNNKEIIDQRVDYMQEQLDGIEKKNEDITTVLIDLKVGISRMQNDIEHIKNKLDRKV